MTEPKGHTCPECGTPRGPDNTPSCDCTRRASDALRDARTAEAAAAEDFDPLRIRPYIEVTETDAIGTTAPEGEPRPVQGADDTLPMPTAPGPATTDVRLFDQESAREQEPGSGSGSGSRSGSGSQSEAGADAGSGAAAGGGSPEAAPGGESLGSAPGGEPLRSTPGGEPLRSTPGGEPLGAGLGGESPGGAPGGEPLWSTPGGELLRSAPGGELLRAVPDEVAPEESPRRSRPASVLSVAGVGVAVVAAAGFVIAMFAYQAPSRDRAAEEVRQSVPDVTTPDTSSAPVPSGPTGTASSALSPAPSTSASPSSSSPSAPPPTASGTPSRPVSPPPSTATAVSPDSAPEPVSGPVLRHGDQGPEVTELQLRLKQLNLYTNPANGVFNNPVEYAVRTYQQARGISDDTLGEYGPATRASLEAETTEP
ncbi:peptidoglycan-binding domain-containing protein [Streptomyces sp. NPDC002523]